MKHNIRIPIPKCPLAYEVPHIPSNHTAIVIDINTADIDFQERMLPWTLASLINNTDIVMKGVHLYVHCEEAVRKRIEDATVKIQIQNNGINTPDDKIISKSSGATPLVTLGEHGAAYDSICLYDINYWAFRGYGNSEKLPLGHVLQHNWGWGVADYSLSKTGWMGTHLNDPQWGAEYLHDANTAVYGENYEKKNKNVAEYFFNETQPNWHIDTSLLHYSDFEANNPLFIEWAAEWTHFGRDVLIALWLLKTHQHAYNLRDSIMIDFPRFKMARTIYPQLCNMQFPTTETFRDAIKQLTATNANLAIQGGHDRQ